MSRAVREVIVDLVASGLSPEQLALVVELAASASVEAGRSSNSSGAKRTRRWRERHNPSQPVTNVTDPSPEQPVTVTSQPSRDVTSDNALLLTSLSSPVKESEEKKVRGSHRKKPLSPLSQDWVVPARARELAAGLGVDILEIEDRFRDYLSSSGKLYADYDAGFCNFVRNTPKFNGNRAPPNRKKGFLDIALDLEREIHERDSQDFQEYPPAEH